MLEYFFDNNVSDLWNSGKTSEAQEISFLLPAEKPLLELIASEKRAFKYEPSTDEC